MLITRSRLPVALVAGAVLLGLLAATSLTLESFPLSAAEAFRRWKDRSRSMVRQLALVARALHRGETAAFGAVDAVATPHALSRLCGIEVTLGRATA